MAAADSALSDGAQVEIVNQCWPLAQDGRQTEHCSYADLVADARVETSLSFRFLSPISFRSQDMHYPLPDPVMAFQSWLSRWNAFAPQDLRLNVNTLDLVAAHVAIARFRLETRAVTFDRYTQIGFVGTVTYQVIKSRLLGHDLIRRLNILADYAPSAAPATRPPRVWGRRGASILGRSCAIGTLSQPALLKCPHRRAQDLSCALFSGKALPQTGE